NPRRPLGVCELAEDETRTRATMKAIRDIWRVIDVKYIEVQLRSSHGTGQASAAPRYVRTVLGSDRPVVDASELRRPVQGSPARGGDPPVRLRSPRAAVRVRRVCVGGETSRWDAQAALRGREPVRRLREGARDHPGQDAVGTAGDPGRRSVARHRRADLPAEHLDGKGHGPDVDGPGRSGPREIRVEVVATAPIRGAAMT